MLKKIQLAWHKNKSKFNSQLPIKACPNLSALHYDSDQYSDPLIAFSYKPLIKQHDRGSSNRINLIFLIHCGISAARDKNMVEFIHHLCIDSQMSEGLGVSSCHRHSQHFFCVCNVLIKVPFFNRHKMITFSSNLLQISFHPSLSLALYCINLRPSAPHVPPPSPSTPPCIASVSFSLKHVTQTHTQCT